MRGATRNVRMEYPIPSSIPFVFHCCGQVGAKVWSERHRAPGPKFLTPQFGQRTPGARDAPASASLLHIGAQVPQPGKAPGTPGCWRG